MNKWIVRILWFSSGVIVGTAISSVWVYYAVGGICLIGGAIQAQMRKRVKKVIDISPNGTQDHKAIKRDFKPGHH